MRSGTRGASSTRTPSTPLLVAAAGLVIAVVAVVLVFGVQSPPQVASLRSAEQPAPQAAIAWMEHDRGEACVHVAWSDGSSGRPWCESNGGEVVGWESEGIVVSDYSGSTAQQLVVHPRSGEVLEVRGDPVYPTGEPAEPGVVSYRDGGEQVFVLGDRELWRVEAPESYDVRSWAVSPDGAWVAIVDEAERLLVVPSDGSAPPVQWAAEVSTWGPVVWEGAGI